MQSKTFQVKLPNNKDLVVTRINAEDISKPIEIQSIHHILLLDRSGSMSNEISLLIDNVKESIKAIGNDDYISVIWFSGVGQFRTLIKGAKKYDYLPNLLDSIKSTIGATCFSESLSEVKTVIDEMEYLTPYYCVTLFTDGNAVTPWSSEEEMTKSRKLVEEISLKSLAFNTIGYGNYYNQEFLKTLSGMSQFGIFTHASSIDSYFDIIKSNFESISSMVNVSTKIFADKIIYISPKSVKSDDIVLIQRQRSKYKNIYYATGTDVIVNDTVINTSMDTDTWDSMEYYEFMYSYAYSLYYDEKRKESLDVLLTLGDKNLIDSHMNSFTYDETSVHLAKLKSAVFNISERNINQVGIDYLPSKDAFCLLDLFKLLDQDNAKYVPFSKNIDSYNRITKKTEDEFNVFEADDKEVLAPVSDLVFNSKHLNLSLRFKIDGKVKINPKSATAVGLPTKIDSCIYRNHTFIKDGNLNVKAAEFEVNKFVIEELINNDVCFSILENDSRVVIDLTSIPIISYKYVKDLSIDKLHDLVTEELELEAMQKVINFRLDKLEEEGGSKVKKTGEFKSYTAAQIKVLEDHGISKQLVYQGVKNTQTLAEDCDFYETRTMEFYIQGVSALPSINDLNKRIEENDYLVKENKETKKLTTGQKILSTAVGIIDNILLLDKVEPKGIKYKRWLEYKQREIKLCLLKIRTDINALKLAKLLTGDWFDNLQADDKGNYIHVNKFDTLVAKVSRTKVYI